jgi:hypothetical protein
LFLHLAILPFDPVQAAPATLGASAAGSSAAPAAGTAAARRPGADATASARRDGPEARSAAPLPVTLASAAPVPDVPKVAVAQRPAITPGSGALAVLAMLAWIVSRRHRPD